jgi:hypothetical protein
MPDFGMAKRLGSKWPKTLLRKGKCLPLFPSQELGSCRPSKRYTFWTPNANKKEQSLLLSDCSYKQTVLCFTGKEFWKIASSNYFSKTIIAEYHLEK